MVLVEGLLALLFISSVNNFDCNGHTEYPLLSFTVGMNGVCMDISLVLVIASQFLFLVSYFLFLVSCCGTISFVVSVAVSFN